MAPVLYCERRERSEETRFWGVVVPRRPSHMWPYGTVLLPWHDKLPDGKPVHYYPLFSSKEKAEDFVRERGHGLSMSDPPPFEETLGNVRRVYRDEMPGDHYVNMDGASLVMWAALL
jgi:hypothetical protein